jgi:ATP-dependent RNA helicase DDX19/DBP5
VRSCLCVLCVILQVVADDTLYTSAMSFEDLNLSPELLQGLYSEMKFEKPSKIQAATLPMIVTPPYKNLIAQAHKWFWKDNVLRPWHAEPS